MSRIAVVSDDQVYVAQIRALAEMIDMQVINAGSNAEIEATSAMGVVSQRPDVVILGPGLDLEHRVALTDELDALNPGLVVIWGVEDDAHWWRTAMQAGARDLLPLGADDEEVVAHLRRAVGLGDRWRSSPVDLPEADDAPRRGRVVSVVSPKGGSGKTMLSSNLAVGLQSRSTRGVVLVDLDLQFGDVAAALGLQPEYSLIDVLKGSGDATAVKAFLTPHESGLFVLTAPTNPAEADDAEPDQVAKLIDLLALEFDYVIIDTGAGIHESTLVAIEQSTDIMFITTIDVAAIQAMRKAVVVLDRLRLDQHRRFFVLNRSSSRTGLSKGEIEEVTGLAIDVEVPSHRMVSKSMNEGSSIMASSQRSKVGKALTAVTELLLPTSASRKRRSL